MNLDFCFLAMGNSSRNDAAGTSRTFSLILFVISTILLSAFVTPSYCHSADSSLHQEAELQDDHHHQLFSRVQRISARVTRETHVSVRGSQRHREKRHVPLSSTIDDNGGHVEKITVVLPLDGKQYTLDLQLNRDLIPKGYFERTQRDNKTVVHRPTYEEAEVCHYHGKIRGLPHSWAAISTCDGIIRGALFDGEQLHYIEPGSSSSKDSIRKEVKSNSIFNKDDDDASSASWDLIHLKHADLKRNMSCGHGDHHDHQSSFNNILGITNDLLTSHPFKTKDSKLSEAGSAPHLHRVKRGSNDETRVPYNSNAKSRYVEVVIVVDNKKYKELGADIKAVRRRSKDIAGIVNALYAPLNIFIALVGMVVWTESDEIVIKPNGDDTLASFLHYRKERLLKEHPNDNAQLLTAVEFENGVVGKAMQGPICSYKYSGGVNSDFKNNVIGVVATTVAHELGHNFGLSHDTESCTCPSPNNRCIMAASASSNRTMHWSSCSLKDFAYAFDHGMDYCLRNKPESLYDGPTCGNGFTEPGEECDCGLAEHCENPCCDASTCLMHHNATCASGTCCDMETCHVKAGGTVCREGTKLCDLPEYCTGDSEFCPDDVKKMDGLTCETPSGKSYCYNGECRTHTDQCRLLWGPSGNNSNDLCYQKNANGSRHAHCGYNLTTEKYAKCDSEDVKCGILHCQMNSEKLEFGYESVSILASFFVNAGGKIHPCRSVIVDFGLSDINPGMVPDGAKCGDNKMCVNQKCVAVDSILGAKYPVCAHDCSGRGVCNSKGNCHCEDGYGGHYCEASGYGGSIDSGPAVDPYGTSKFFKILYVTFLGFIPLIAIITFYIYYAGDYFKKLCYSIITLQAFKDNRSQRGNKPSSNGGGFRSVDISSPTAQQNHSGQNGAPPGQGGEQPDFFGQYKGFSLSPIKSSPLPQQRSGGANNGTTSSSSATSHNNNNVEVTTASTASLPNGSIQSQTNSNVYYSSVPKQTETLLGNSDKSFRVGNPQTTLVQNSGGNRSVRVSWAQPISSPLPVSPGSEDESANSDTPLYENTGAEKSSPKIQKLAQSPSLQRAKARPMSSPDALNEMKKFGGKASPAGEPNSPTVKKESTFGSTSALSRIAAAFPFVRNSFRISGSSDDNAKNSPGKSNKGFPKHRGTLEISKPILQTDFDKNSTLQPVTPTGQHDQVDSPCYANLPAQQQHQESIKKPALKNADRIKAASPPPSTGSTISKPIPKVQRAHSMIQPSSNRNSVHNSNPNYNSLRRPRPSMPPPKPPEAPPPPPPTYMSSSFSDAKSKFLQSSTPPPVPPPNDAVTSRASQSPKGIRSSISRFTFGNRSRSASPSSSSIKPPPPTTTNYSPNNNTTPTLFKAPIAQVEELSSPCSPPGSASKKDKENIYDTIDEGMVTVALKKSNGLKKKDSCEGSSSGDSSPTQGKKSNGGSSEKIETLSTGSSESNNGGLLSEIISEIQSRNKESIYNSVDRRKKKREKKAAAASAALFASIKQEQSKPEITPKPSLSTLSASRKNSGSNLLASSSTSPREASSSSSPNSSRRYVSPLTNQSFSFYKKPVGPSSTPPGKLDEAEKPKVVLNPTVVNPPVSTSSSRPSSFTSLASAKSTPSSTITPPKPIFSNTFSRSSVSPPVVTSNSSTAPVVTKPVRTSGTGASGSALSTATVATSAAKPTCAVNGVPKVTTSPSYVAKINYFSNLTQASNTPMKPINSIPAPSKENAAKEIIYAPSNVDLSGDDSRGNGGSHYAATIRRSRPVYYNNKDLESDLNDANSNPVTDNNSTTSNKQGTLGRKPLGIYGSLGRKVATPVIRSNSIEKEKQEARARSRSRESTPDTSTTASSVENETTGSSGGESGSPQVGYKPFNPYLNRPLTFSTFRPSGGAKTSVSSSTSNNSTPTSRPTLTMHGSNTAKGGLNGTTCSVSSKPVPGVTNGVGVVASPVQLRSPNRLVK